MNKAVIKGALTTMVVVLVTIAVYHMLFRTNIEVTDGTKVLSGSATQKLRFLK